MVESNSGRTPLELDALFVFALPLLLTLAKLADDVEMTPLNLLSDFLQPLIRLISVCIASPNLVYMLTSTGTGNRSPVNRWNSFGNVHQTNI